MNTILIKYYNIYNMNDFLFLKLNRTIWLSLLLQEKIAEAVNYFESYTNDLMRFKRINKNDAEKELSFSKSIFLKKITELGEKFIKNKDYTNATLCYTFIFKVNPNNIKNIKNYITCLNELEQFDLALDVANQLKIVDSNDIAVNKIFAEIYAKQKNFEKAINCFEKFIKSSKKEDLNADDYNLLGCYYNAFYLNGNHDIEIVKNGIKNFRIACNLSPNNKMFFKNLTISATKASDWNLCKEAWNKIFELGNLTNDDKYDYAAFCLKTQNFEDWHKFFGYRFAKENNKTFFPKIDKPEWKGTKDISNSTLLVYYEQGFGDTFLMCGYILRLVKLAKKVIFVCQNEIYPLLKDNLFGVEVYKRDGIDINKLDFDYYIPAMSIPTTLKLKKENISVGGGYINADKSLVRIYKDKFFNNNKFKIGISFSGSNNGDKLRDIPIKEFLPLEKLKNVELYSLIRGISDDEFKCFKKIKVKNIGNEFKDFAQTAAAIENLDLIITSDNCILNLAGAMGKKTFAIFNWQSQFRWFELTEDDIVWFKSVKPFVNNKIDNWSFSIKNVINETEKLLNC